MSIERFQSVALTILGLMVRKRFWTIPWESIGNALFDEHIPRAPTATKNDSKSLYEEKIHVNRNQTQHTF